jgi:hypothetical protein
MDPILLFAIAGRRYVIDGHLRAQAFSRAGTEHIQVCHFQGTFDEALLKSVSENAKARLSLTREQRTESAWKLVKWSAANFDCYSKSVICKHTGVSDGTVGTMRRVLKDKNLGFSPRALSWEKVRHKLNSEGDGVSTYSDEKRQEKLGRWIKGFRRATGKGGDRDPQTAKEAFETAHPRAAALFRDEAQADAEEGAEEDTFGDS